MPTEEKELKLLDITTPTVVEITLASKNLWINVDGVCRLRVTRANQIVIHDHRKTGEPNVKS